MAKERNICYSSSKELKYKIFEIFFSMGQSFICFHVQIAVAIDLRHAELTCQEQKHRPHNLPFSDLPTGEPRSENLCLLTFISRIMMLVYTYYIACRSYPQNRRGKYFTQVSSPRPTPKLNLSISFQFFYLVQSIFHHPKYLTIAEK